VAALAGARCADVFHVLNQHNNLPRTLTPLLQRWRHYAAQMLVSALVAASSLAIVPAAARGQEAPTTIWQMLGIGADQYSDNPAIKAAAKAKAAKHEICKKKRALEYLAGMGCSPEHPEVGPALIAAMGDPDEPVRYAAVKAVLQTAGDCQCRDQKRSMRKALGCVESCHDWKKKVEKAICECIDRLFGKAPPKEWKCKKKIEECCENLKGMVTGKKPCPDPTKQDCPCGNGHGPCCSEDMKKKLQELAYGRDENGCFLETSERVRTVAELALKACASCDGQRFGGSPSYSVVRELPPVLERELPPNEDQNSCRSDRAIIAVPESKIRSEEQPTPAAEPMTLPTEPLILPAEPLPPPTSRLQENTAARPLRSILVASSQRGNLPTHELPQQRSFLSLTPPPLPERKPRQWNVPQQSSATTRRYGMPNTTARGQEQPRRTESLPPWAVNSHVEARVVSQENRTPRWASSAPLSKTAPPEALPPRSRPKNLRSSTSLQRSLTPSARPRNKVSSITPAQAPLVTQSAAVQPKRTAPPVTLTTTRQTTNMNEFHASLVQPKPRPAYLLRIVAILVSIALVIKIFMILITPQAASQR